MSVRPWRNDFDCFIALHIDPQPFQSSIVFRVSIAEPPVRHDDASDNDLATLAREITARHGVDKRSLLALAARRDAGARNAARRLALESDFILKGFRSRVQSLNRQSMPSRLAQLAPRNSRREPRDKLVPGVLEWQKAHGALWVIHDLNEKLKYIFTI